MKISSFTTLNSSRALLTTDELAEVLLMRPQSLRKRYSQTGSYFGLRPIKLPNGLLRWPADALQRLVDGAKK